MKPPSPSGARIAVSLLLFQLLHLPEAQRAEAHEPQHSLVKRTLFYPVSKDHGFKAPAKDREGARVGDLPLEPHYPSEENFNDFKKFHSGFQGSFGPLKPSHKPFDLEHEVPTFHAPFGQGFGKPSVSFGLNPENNKRRPHSESLFNHKPVKHQEETFHDVNIDKFSHQTRDDFFNRHNIRALNDEPTFGHDLRQSQRFHHPKPKPAYEEPYVKHRKEPKNADIRNHIPGEPGVDYPIYRQAYHVCNDDRHGPQGAAFLCTNGTIFNQQTFNCDWWYSVDCGKARTLYDLNLDPDHNPYYKKPLQEPHYKEQELHSIRELKTVYKHDKQYRRPQLLSKTIFQRAVKPSLRPIQYERQSSQKQIKSPRFRPEKLQNFEEEFLKPETIKEDNFNKQRTQMELPHSQNSNSFTYGGVSDTEELSFSPPSFNEAKLLALSRQNPNFSTDFISPNQEQFSLRELDLLDPSSYDWGRKTS